MIRKAKQILLLTILIISGCIITLNYNPTLTYFSKLGNLLAGDTLYDSVSSIISNLDDSTKWKSHLKTKTKIDSSLKIPQVYFEPARNHQLHIFDPRFTFGTIFKYLRENSGKEDLQIPQFHWSDWTDLSYLNQFYFKEPKFKCEEFNINSPKESEIKKPIQFCFDDADIPGLLESSTDEKLKQYISNIQLLPYSTNFHVFETGGRSTLNFKRMQSKSYLAEFMPAPLNVVFLLPKIGGNNGGRGVKIPVNQDIKSKQRIVNSKMYEDTIVKPKVEIVDVQKEIEEMDILKLNPTENNEQNFEETLHPWMFTDLSREISRQFEAKPHLIKTNSDKIYKESLAYSLDTKVQTKYFSEAKLLKKQKNWAYGGHYDWRFFNKLDNFSDKKKPIISNLLAAWLKFTNTYNVKTWIAHGSLLSWYWNGAPFPWDVDIDVQVPISELHKLAHGFNQSIIVDLGLKNGDEIRYGRYFLDCGSFISHRERENGANIIDARFIDIDTGLYIDITALALSDTEMSAKYKSLGFKTYQLTANKSPLEQFHKQNNEKGQFYNCRNNHFVHLLQVSPLRLSYVEGVPCQIPNDFIGMLAVEYKQSSLIEKSFKPLVSTFMMRLQLWVSNQAINKFYRSDNFDIPPKIPSPPVNASPKVQRDHDPFANWEDHHYIKFLEAYPDIMEEYFLMRNFTLLHQQERQLYESKRLPKSVIMDKNKHLIEFPRLRHDVWNYDRDFSIDLFGKEAKRLEDMIEKSKLLKS